MADRKHPKTHVEDQNLDKPRKQPLSPQHEGIDPLTESDTMYPAENVKEASERLAKKEASAPEGSGADKPDADNRTLEDHLDADNQPSVEDTASETNEAADEEDVEGTNNSNTDTDQEQLAADEELAASTEPGQPDDDTPDAGEKAEDQEPHTDKGNTSPANRTTRSRSK